ncbi:GNAT family N-acetyltransferase [Paenibacillus sp. MAH-36]|uniref:GNAT family N-acetyltransferase n=1 Tax=Paenibacillus violae TaxID=3077234 RepID=A0ABU3RM16_9BACL|nr:GNAT family N-acetyltransferase [Paenibacillus sp. PFR10]MDU0205141.1 GNAT family N-acetyltransferase [Paenibacillus sp. PFR10]
MENIRYLELKEAGTLLEQMETLFVLMYDYMGDKGLLQPLVPGGEKMWSKSLLPTLGKFGVVWLALNGEEVIGFIQGMIKLLPNYLGGGKVGIISHVYVKPEMRQYGIGSELAKKLEEWFVTKNIDSIELQVLYHNEKARNFWENTGYEYEVYQMRKFLVGVSE